MRRVILAAAVLGLMLIAGGQARADLTQFVVPIPGATGTIALGINNRGQVLLGYYLPTPTSTPTGS